MYYKKRNIPADSDEDSCYPGRRGETIDASAIWELVYFGQNADV